MATFWRLIKTVSPGRYSNERHYTVAITRDVPQSFSKALTSSTTPQSISFAAAREQHQHYVSFIRTILPTVNLAASEDHPDCVFVEDSAVAIGRTAVVSRIGAPTRVGEVGAIRSALVQLGLSVTDMTSEFRDGATCDGGDVLHPITSSFGRVRPTAANEGRHLFVGMSGRTNEEGFNVLDKVFGREGLGIEVVPVPDIEGSGSLHLKSIVTHVDDKTLLVPRGQMGDEILSAMRSEKRGYVAIRLPDVSACNVVSVNGVILAPPTGCEETRMIFEKEMKERGLRIHYLPNSEFAKCDGALTCRSILLDV